MVSIRTRCGPRVTSYNSSPLEPRRLLARGDVWIADLDLVHGHEQAGRRPVLIISANRLNRSTRGLLIAIPITSHVRAVIPHVLVRSPEGGLAQASVIMCEQIRVISILRLGRRRGSVSDATLRNVSNNLSELLALSDGEPR